MSKPGPPLVINCYCGQTSLELNESGLQLGNHLVCYCESCRKFPSQVGAQGEYIDEYGGSRILQVPPACVRITGGQENLNSLKLTPKGPDRWFTRCCQTPLANTSIPALPFLALIIPSDLQQQLDSRIGAPNYHVNVEGALKTLAPERKASNMAAYLFKFLGQMISWRLKGLATPRPFERAQGD